MQIILIFYSVGCRTVLLWKIPPDLALKLSTLHFAQAVQFWDFLNPLKLEKL